MSQVQLYNEFNEKTEVFLFHIQKKALNFFCRSINNKSFMLYLLCLELSNRKGFCRLNTKELAKTFKVTAKSICNWLKDIHNNSYITAYYNPHKHYWKVRVNTKRHYELWKKFDGEEMPNSQFSDDDINDILNVLDGKPKENNAVVSEKTPNVTNNIDNANSNSKNDNTNKITTQSIFELASDLIENPNILDDLGKPNDETLSNLSNNDNSSFESETLEAPQDENSNNSNEHNDENIEKGTESIENAETESNSNENLNENQDGGNEMSEEELEELELEESARKMKAFMERFNLGVNKKRDERENQKVLIVTPYKTYISDSNVKNDTDNVKFTLEMIETFEKMERERISYYVGQPISPIKKALRNAKARIRAKNVTAQEKINEIMQTTLNKIDFLKEIESVDSVSIWCINYNNLQEINAIQEKAKLLNKQVNLNFMSYLNDSETKIRLEQIKNGIDDPFFYMTPPNANDSLDFDISKPAQSTESDNNDDNTETPAEAEVS